MQFSQPCALDHDRNRTSSDEDLNSRCTGAPSCTYIVCAIWLAVTQLLTGSIALDLLTVIIDGKVRSQDRTPATATCDCLGSMSD